MGSGHCQPGRSAQSSFLIQNALGGTAGAGEDVPIADLALRDKHTVLLRTRSIWPGTHGGRTRRFCRWWRRLTGCEGGVIRVSRFCCVKTSRCAVDGAGILAELGGGAGEARRGLVDY